MIVYNYYPITHYVLYVYNGRTHEIFTPQWAGIYYDAYPEAALSLMDHNEKFQEKFK